MGDPQNPDVTMPQAASSVDPPPVVPQRPAASTSQRHVTLRANEPVWNEPVFDTGIFDNNKGQWPRSAANLVITKAVPREHAKAAHGRAMRSRARVRSHALATQLRTFEPPAARATTQSVSQPDTFFVK